MQFSWLSCFRGAIWGVAIADALAVGKLPWDLQLSGDRSVKSSFMSPPVTPAWSTALAACGQQVLVASSPSPSSIPAPIPVPEIAGRLAQTPAAAAIVHLPILLRHRQSFLVPSLGGESPAEKPGNESTLILQDQALMTAEYAHRLVLGWLQGVSQNAGFLSPFERLEALKHHLMQPTQSVTGTVPAEVKVRLEPLLIALDEVERWLHQPTLAIADPVSPAQNRLPLSPSLLAPLVWALYYSLTAAENYSVAVGRALRLRHSFPLVVVLTGLFSGILARSTGLPHPWLTSLLAETGTPSMSQWEFPPSGVLRQLPDQLYAAWIGINRPYSVSAPTVNVPVGLPTVLL